MLLFVAIFAASYAIAHQARQRARPGRARPERACRHGQDRHGEPRGLLSGCRGPARAAVGHPEHSRHRPDGSGRGGHRRPGAEGRGRTRPRNRSGPVWTARRCFLAHDVSYFVHLNELQARRRDHVPDGLQHGDVRGERTAGRAGRLTGFATRPHRAWSSTRAGRPMRCSSRRTASWCGPPRCAAVTKGGTLNPGAEFIDTGQVHRLRAPRHRRRCRRRGLTLEQNEAPMGTMHLVNAVGGLRPVARVPSRSRRPHSRPTSAGCTPGTNDRRRGGQPLRRAWGCRRS